MAALDPIAAMAATDKEKLDELMHQVQSDNTQVQQMFSDIAEKEGIYGDLPTLDELEDKYGEPGKHTFGLLKVPCRRKLTRGIKP